MKFAGVLATALAALLLIAACGGDDDDAPTDSSGESTPALTENDLAESMLLTRANLPGNFIYTPPDGDEEPNPLDECEPGDPAGLTGKAEGGEFSRGGTDTITEDVRIFEDADAVIANIEDVLDGADCMERMVNDGDLDNEGFEYSDLTFEENDDFPSFGDETWAYQVKIHVVATDDGGNEEEGDVYLDLVFVAIDNIGFSVIAADVFDPYPPADIAVFTEIAAAKILSILNGDDDDDRASPTPDEDETEPPGDEPPSGAGSSQGDPVPLGESGVINGRAEVQVLSVEFDAEAAVLAEDSTNVATADKNMVLMKIEITNVGDEDLDVFFDLFYNLIGDKGTPYDEFDPSCGLVPDEIEGVLETGESVEGSVCVQADEDDSDLVFLLEMFGDDVEQEVLYLALE